MDQIEKYDITIIGGGLAGMVSANLLARQGLKVAIVEKRAFLGGRIYSFQESKTQDDVDNGQHALMGAYHYTLDYLASLKILHKLKFLNPLNIPILTKQEDYSLNCKNLPGSLHLLSGLLRIPGLNFIEKCSIVKAMLRIKFSSEENYLNLSCLEILKKLKQTDKLIHAFWEPLILATLNESLHVASALLFRQVLKKAFLAKKQDSLLILAREGLSSTFCQPTFEELSEHQVDFYFNQQVQTITQVKNFWQINNNSALNLQSDKILFCVPPNALNKITLPAQVKELLSTESFIASPILSINLWFEEPIDLPMITAFSKSPLHWVFNKNKIFSKNNSYLSVLISDAHEWIDLKKEQIVSLCLAELTQFFPTLQGKRLKHSQVIKEKEATFGNKVHEQCARPNCVTSIHGLYLAGDWTNTGLPSTIESAVKSAYLAAQAILNYD